ncbi:MAG: hypothetical protein ABIP03_08525 [Aquihabitans sp.]
MEPHRRYRSAPAHHAPIRRQAHRALLCAVMVSTIAILTACEPTPLASVPQPSAAVTGTVYAVAQVGDRTIIGGDFTAVGGVPRQNAAAILADGSLDPTFDPAPDGIVYAVAGAPNGSRVFLGGSFLNAGGAPRTHLAAVDPSTGAADPNWLTTADSDVFALAVSGTRLYAGGRFMLVGGTNRRRLAAIDTTSGAVQLGFNPFPDWTVKAVVVSPDGSKVYAAGGFTAIGGQPRLGAAEVLAATGSATAFDPAKGGVALAAALTPDGTRFYFSTTDNRVYGYDPALSNAPAQTVQGGGDTQAIAASATTVYIGGHFSQVWTGQPKIKRSRIASFLVADSTISAWDPGADGYLGVWALAVTPTGLLVGGDFIHLGGVTQPGFGRFSGTP